MTPRLECLIFTLITTQPPPWRIMKTEDDEKTEVKEIEGDTGEKTGEEKLDEIDETRGEIVERLVNDEYKSWKSNTPFLYDLVISHALEWPSLTIEWLPDQVEPQGMDYTVQKMILGTHTADSEPNYLIIAQVKLPLMDDDMNDVAYGCLDCNGDRSLLATRGNRKIEVIQKINHDGEVHRARYMPQNPFTIATKTCSSEVRIFDYRNHPSKPPLGGACNPDLRLRGHSDDGYGLAWSKFKPGVLLSGSNDGKICLWDINATPNNKALDAMRTFQSIDRGPVEDVAWHCRLSCMFGSCDSDGYVHIFDLRCRRLNTPIESFRAHQSEILSLVFSPFNDWLVATGSTDKTMKLFDRRKNTIPLNTFARHKDDVVQVGWSPQNETILASCSSDRRLMVWDLSRIGESQTSEDGADGPPELLFIHGGHTSGITEFSLNPCEDWIVASVADDNILQVWQMAEHIYNDEED